jgi:hypothetical protein
MKDEYVKYIMREQVRREKEFKDRSHDKEMIYNKIKNTYKKDENNTLLKRKNDQKNQG